MDEPAELPDRDGAAVLEANRAFYAAFEARDLDALAAVCERTGRATVTHPGWPTLHGWARVVGSWDAIFANTPFIQFHLGNEQVQVAGDAAWVTLDEHILQAHGDGRPEDRSTTGSRIAATNVFVRVEGEWRLVHHHGSPVADTG